MNWHNCLLFSEIEVCCSLNRILRSLNLEWMEWLDQVEKVPFLIVYRVTPMMKNYNYNIPWDWYITITLWNWRVKSIHQMLHFNLLIYGIILLSYIINLCNLWKSESIVETRHTVSEGIKMYLLRNRKERKNRNETNRLHRYLGKPEYSTELIPVVCNIVCEQPNMWTCS